MGKLQRPGYIQSEEKMKEKTQVYKQVKGCCKRKRNLLICQTSSTEDATYITTNKMNVMYFLKGKKKYSEQITCQKLPHELLLR